MTSREKPSFRSARAGPALPEASYRLVRSLCPQSTVLEGIQIRRGTYDTAYERVIAWLQEIGIVELNNEGNDEKINKICHAVTLSVTL